MSNEVGGIGTMMGVVMFSKGASDDCIGSSGEGLLDEEPMAKGLSAWIVVGERLAVTELAGPEEQVPKLFCAGHILGYKA